MGERWCALPWEEDIGQDEWALASVDAGNCAAMLKRNPIMTTKRFRAWAVIVALAVVVAIWGSGALATKDSLPSWNDTETKRAIVDFVETVTDPASPSFVPPDRRIATFDNDGTLWVSHPIYTQFQYVFDRIRELAPEHPEWRHEQPYKAILEGDRAFLKRIAVEDVVKLVMATHAGMTPQQFELAAHRWLATARHPRYHVAYTSLVYQPMLELMAYLRSAAFKVFIVTGGGQSFVRAYAAKAYGVPPWQVVGSSVQTEFRLDDGKGEVVRQSGIDAITNGPGKALGINGHIGVRPIAAFGNSDGDIEMLEYTDSGAGRRLAMLVHHDDPQHEYAYTCDTKVGRLCKGLERAAERGWILISMKRDWKILFPFELNTP